MRRRRSPMPGLLTYEHDPDDLLRLQSAHTDRQLLLLFGTILEQLLAGRASQAQALWDQHQGPAILERLRRQC